MSFGENLTNLRRQKGWSQDDLANNLDLSRQAISKWENETSKPDIDNIKKISKIFSIKIDDLINNELPDDKAVTLDVKKEEKREKTITIIKLMIIAVIILYVISVIYKFASLLVIVNGVQKYANLNNYHYVITTYDENGLAEKEECWFKDGVSKTINTMYENEYSENITYVDFINNYGYVLNTENDRKEEFNVDEYRLFHNGFENGAQLISQFPNVLYNQKTYSYLVSCISKNHLMINLLDGGIVIDTQESLIDLDKKTLFPKTVYYKQNGTMIIYNVEIGTVEKVKI